jgi:hypothetical protein
MNWKAFLKSIFRNTLLTFVVAMAGLGLIGFLLAGKEGFLNGLSCGLILGIIALLASLFSLLEPLFLGDLAGDANPKWRKENEETKEE